MDDPDTPTATSRGAAAFAGVVGAGVALGTGELVSAVLGAVPSPLLAVGGRFVDRFAASLKELAVELFGTNDKPALVVGTIIISLVLGAGVGVLARRRRWAPAVGLGAFGAAGAVAQSIDPQVGALDAWLTAGASVVAGVLAIHLLLRLATPAVVGEDAPAPGSVPSDDASAAVPLEGMRSAGDGSAMVTAGLASRRRFLGAAAGLALAAAGAAAMARSLNQVDVLAKVRDLRLPRPLRRRTVPAAQPFPVDGISPYVTPTSDFYRIDTALSAPRVDPDGWRLEVGGMVDRPFSLSYADLLELPSVEEVVTLQCVSNEVGGGLVGNATWQGVPLADLLERAGVQPGADQVFSRSVDGWTAGFPTEAARDGRVALVAYAMNGELLPVRHGFPARLVVSGLYGYVSATKWLRSIELAPWDGVEGYWVPRGWSKEGPIKLTSRIDVPRNGTAVRTAADSDAVTLGGVAWAPSVGISAVEASVDDGPWEPCRLGRVASAHTWVQWHHRVSVAPGRHVARVRCTDAAGTPQDPAVTEPAPNGATGLHRVSFTVEAP